MSKIKIDYDLSVSMGYLDRELAVIQGKIDNAYDVSLSEDDQDRLYLLEQSAEHLSDCLENLYKLEG